MSPVAALLPASVFVRNAGRAQPRCLPPVSLRNASSAAAAAFSVACSGVFSGA